MKYAIFFESVTGNNEALANKIKEALPAEECVAFGKPDEEALKEAELVFIGSPARGNNFMPPVLDFLAKMENKKVAPFMVAGYGDTPAFFGMILDRIESKIPESNEVVGRFAVQGKLHESLVKKYSKMYEGDEENNEWKAWMANYERSQSRPNQNDFDRAVKFAKEVYEKANA